MADSFADLWTSSAPAKQTQQPKRLEASASQKPNPPSQRPQRDAFSVLSASQPTRTHPPLQAQVQQKPVTVPQRQNVSSDAFSGLFDASMGFGSGNTNATSNMSMAEKATLVQKGKQLPVDKGGISSQSPVLSAWDGLDSLAQTGVPVVPSTMTTAPSQDNFDLTLGHAKAIQKVDSGANISGDDWGLSDFSSSHLSTQLQAQSGAQSLWDLDDFSSPSPHHSQRDASTSFNLANQSDRESTLFDGTGYEDDILGDLGKPVNPSTHSSPSRRLSPIPSAAQQSSCTTTASPPPHITGQLVEMGFTPQIARSALVSTSTADGFDVQAALDWLLAHREASSPSESDNHRPGGLNYNRDSETVVHTSKRPQTRTTRRPTQLDSRSARQAQPNSDTTDFPASADRLLAQAGEIGRGMFSRANALFKEGKEKAMKMYEERAGASSSADGRPRWMRGSSGEGGLREDTLQGSFKDPSHESKACTSKSFHGSPSNVQSEAPPLAMGEDVDLFSNDASQIIHQPYPPTGKPNAETTPPTSNSTSSRSPPQEPPHVPSPQLTATIPSAVFGTYQSQKSAGTDAYRLGQYPAAAAAYSRALASLPEGHVLCLPLLTNRAAALSKVGELSGVAEDCSAAIVLVERYVSNVTVVNTKIGRIRVVIDATGGTNKDTEVDLAGGLMKAYQRRAEAYEGLEKWARALADWKVLIGAEWAVPARSLAASGAARCQGMIGGGDESVSNRPKRPGIRSSASSNVVSQPPKPRPKRPTASTSVGAGESSAVAALRAAANVAASEDAERSSHKDAVDARLLAWRQGKETNIRALLTTLDGVLWPELGWKKVGMAEVVGKGQVKVAYMRAIARVHPDKLNTNNTTVEQRMIASGVFGTLNEAWNAFLQQQ
ncbi:hypothetical protein EDD16DRAFT_648696 [Pisolithus croceorrhizus]|nr:hypothetical protein EDD16DRAFT_648696 [Pisolithus croceorrhizus]